MEAEVHDGSPEVHMDTKTEEVQYQRTEFAAVVFQYIPETYPADAHIECKYTITQDLVPTSRDWIGLYKVGWMTTRDYYYYEWAVIPSDYEIGKKAEASNLFPSHKLPGEDGEFYQFCYVSSSGQIRGASTPFQFKNPSADDFVELDDEESDMLVIRSKTVVLEEKACKLEEEKDQLLQLKHDLESERDGLLTKLMELTRTINQLQDDKKCLEDQCKASDNYISQLNQEAKDMMVAREEIQNKANTVDKERVNVEEKLTKVNEELDKMKSVIRKFQSEKDELEGENRTLKEQVELYKNHFTRSESSVRENGQQMEQLQIMLAEQESLVSHLSRKLKEAKTESDELKKKQEKQMTVTEQDKEQIERLNERLRNTEDKLSAAEKVKVMLQAELKSFSEMHEKMSTHLERSEGECHALKLQLTQMEEQLMKESELLKNEIQSAQEDLKSALQEKGRLQEERDELLQSKETTESSLSSLHCLKMAQSSLKDRYSKMEQNYSELQAEYTKKKKESKQRIQDLLREVHDYKERLNMASEEYKALYIEKRKIQKNLEKLTEKMSTKKLVRRVSETSVTGPTVQVETQQMTSPPEVNDDQQSNLSASELSIPSQIDRELDDVGEELTKRKDKKYKYKKLYLDEKEKLEALQKHYHEQTRRKDEEIERLRKQVEQACAETEVKVRSLENFVEDREKTIDELNRKLRDNVKIHDGPKLQSSECGVTEGQDKPVVCPVGPMASGGYPVLMYGNPYSKGDTHFCYPPIIYPHPASMVNGKAVDPPKYPEQRPLEPLRYPATGPATVQPLEILRYPSPDHLSDNQSDASLDPHTPLTPLPAPLQPEKLPNAKIASVKSVLMEGDRNIGEITVEYGDNCFRISDDVVLPSAPPAHDYKEDRFEDAIGDAMKICPVCNDSFSADIEQRNFEEHVLSHVGRICPICHNLVEEVDDKGFQFHVNQHLDKTLEDTD